MKTKDQEIIKKIKKHLRKGDFYVIIRRIEKDYGITFSRSAVASTLNPNSDYQNDIIYTQALKLSIERQNIITETTSLEALLKD